MGLNQILNSIFILPGIKAGIRERIWQENIPDKLKPIKELWQQLGLIDDNGKLSKLGEELYNLNPLIDYYLSLWKDYFFYSHEEKYKITNDQYDLLREGLEVYYKHFLSDWYLKFKLLNKEWNVLDYAGGKGQFLIDFIKNNNKSKGLLVDRNIIKNLEYDHNIYQKAIDFEANPNWYKKYKNKFNLIILSEILHCKNKEGQDYIIDSSIEMLKEDGFILVHEITANPIFDWRMSMYTEGGKSLKRKELEDLVKNKLIPVQSEAFADYMNHMTLYKKVS